MFTYGGGGGSRTRVRNRCQPGVFMLCPLPHVFASGAQNGQDAPEASPIDLVGSRPDRAAPTSLLCDARSQPIGEAEEDGCLVN